MSKDFVIAKVEPAIRMLQQATTPQAAKRVADVAKAAELYARRQKLGKEAEQHAHRIVIDAETLLGEMLASAADIGSRQVRGGDRKSKFPDGNLIPSLSELGINGKDSMNGQFLAKLKDESPEDWTAIREGLKTVSKARTENKRKTVKTHLEKVAAKQPVAPVGQFDVIVIDPPWPMEKIERDCRPNQASELDYPTMNIGDIFFALTHEIFGQFAADNCHVFIWTTQKFLPEVLEYIAVTKLSLPFGRIEYGFTFVWHKPGGFQPVGLPQFNCEFCVYGRIGSPVFVDTKAFNLCNQWPRGKHSEKPEGFYDLLRRVTAGRRLDAYNRRDIDGFIGWGKEASNGVAS